MWDYTEQVLDHFRNPRNVGRIDNPDGVGKVGSLACGDALTLTFRLDEEGRIADAKFQTFGCASAIASSSALTEMIRGMTIEEAEKISNRDIARYLGGLPDQKMHCSVMGREALVAAIHNYRTGEELEIELPDHVERIVCHCFEVSEEEILRVIRDNSLNSLEQVTNYSKAGGGCGKCKPDIEKLLQQVVSERQSAGEASQKPMTNLQKIRLIEEVIERDIRPVLKRDGGDLELLDIEGNRVIIAFRGLCAGCPHSAITRREVVQARLRELVSPAITVVEGDA